jgi:hypothetical protein
MKRKKYISMGSPSMGSPSMGFPSRWSFTLKVGVFLNISHISD